MSFLAPPSVYPPPWEHLLAGDVCNGAYPESVFFLRLAAAVNHLAAWGRHIPASVIALSATPDTDDNWAVRRRVRYRSTQNGTVLCARPTCAPSAAGIALTPGYSWDGGVTPRAVHWRSPAPAEGDVRPVSGPVFDIVDAAVSRNAVQSLAFSTDDRLRLCGLTLWEQPRVSLDTATADLLLNPGRWRVGGPIFDADADALLDAFQALYEQGKHLIAHGADNQAAPHQRLSAVLANLFDQTVAAYGATTPGWPIDIENCASMFATTLAMRVAVYASCAGGQGGTVRAAAASTSVDLAVGAEQWYEATLNAALTDTKLDLLFAGDGAANACKVWAVCAWLYFG